jgi:hypothetical protein
MAQKVTVALEDDLTGGPAEETVFAFEGTDYEIDLNAKNAAALRKQFASLHRACPPHRACTGSPGRAGRGGSAALG